jgi:hypothetical protein
MEAVTEDTGTVGAPDGCKNVLRRVNEEMAQMETDLPNFEEDEPDVGVLDAESGDDTGSNVLDQDGTDNQLSKKPAAGKKMEIIPQPSLVTDGTCNMGKAKKIRLLLPLLLVWGG